MKYLKIFDPATLVVLLIVLLAFRLVPRATGSHHAERLFTSGELRARESIGVFVYPGDASVASATVTR